MGKILSRFPGERTPGCSTGQATRGELQSDESSTGAAGRKDSLAPVRKLTYLHHDGSPCPGPAQPRRGPALANTDEHRMTLPVAADRLRLIQQRLQSHFYEVPPASDRIAVAVLADLNDSQDSSSALPH